MLLLIKNLFQVPMDTGAENSRIYYIKIPISFILSYIWSGCLSRNSIHKLQTKKKNTKEKLERILVLITSGYYSWITKEATNNSISHQPQIPEFKIYKDFATSIQHTTELTHTWCMLNTIKMTCRSNSTILSKTV